MQMSVTLELPRDVLSVPVMRGVLTASLRSVKVAEECVGDIAVAITEACTNVIDHSVEGDDYEVTARLIEERCEIDVVDRGHGFDATLLGREHADITAESGRGIQLMRALVDRVAFSSREEAGTVVRLEKQLVFDDDSPLRDLRKDRNAGGSADGARPTPDAPPA